MSDDLKEETQGQPTLWPLKTRKKSSQLHADRAPLRSRGEAGSDPSGHQALLTPLVQLYVIALDLVSGSSTVRTDTESETQTSHLKPSLKHLNHTFITENGDTV